MDTIEIIGLIAGALTVAGYLPQVIKILKTRKTSGLSLAMYIIMVLSATLWLVYGISMQSLPIIATNGLVFICVSIVSIVKIYEDSKPGH